MAFRTGVSLVALLVLPSLAGAADRSIPVTIRDFVANGQDFGVLNWDTHTPAAFFANDQNNKTEYGIVGPIGAPLGADGHPVLYSQREAGFYNTVTDATQFGRWYTDVPGVNQTISSVALDFNTNRYGRLEINQPQFHPIDGLGLGNEGYQHNYFFTMEMHTTFTYHPGQDFYATADDDLWLYIDKKLVVDLGGVHAARWAELQLDTLGLTEGQTYSADLFYADRATYDTTLIIESSMLNVPEPASMVIISGGLMLLGLRRRRE